MMKHKSKKVAVFGMMIALAFILSYIESLLPPLITALPGMKIGLANLVIVVCLYLLGSKEAFILTIFRVLLVAFTFGNFTMMLFSAAGAVLSFLVMFLLKMTKKFSTIGISCAGGVAHNIGQMLVAYFTLGASLLYYLPFLFISGCISGILIGIAGAVLLKHLPKNLINP